jgi:Fe(3+) dicitrate transport protein
VENNFKLSSKLSLNPGFRMEIGQSDMYGTIVYYNANDIPNTISHKFPLFGVSAQYLLKSNMNIYGGWSQSYRPVIFKDIVPGSVYETVDKDLEDASGYNAEIGFRGATKNLHWDMTFFQLQYNNRMGSQASTDADGNFILYRTNIGDSRTNGAEVLLQYFASLGKQLSLTLFTSTAFMDAKYENAALRSGVSDVDVSGNDVESVPDVITRNGITLKYHFASVSFLYSHTRKSYADPLNTVEPSITGAVGIVPSYSILDINSTFTISPVVQIRLNVSNVTDKQYFTKRPAFYPGPGVWSSDGRSVNVSVGIRI